MIGKQDCLNGGIYKFRHFVTGMYMIYYDSYHYYFSDNDEIKDTEFQIQLKSFK